MDIVWSALLVGFLPFVGLLLGLVARVDPRTTLVPGRGRRS